MFAFGFMVAIFVVVAAIEWDRYRERRRRSWPENKRQPWWLRSG